MIYKPKYLLSISLLLFCLACGSDNDSNEQQQQQANELELMLAEIVELASSKVCEDASQWAFVEYGSKGCGGPVGYIAYSTQLDTEAFLAKVTAYTQAQQTYIETWQIASDCSAPAPPAGVMCEDGKAVFLY